MKIASQPKPRGRPRQFDPDQALDRAVQVFWERGYEGASLDDLTKAMGLNRPSLYAAFGDKRALFLAAIDRYLATIGRAPVTAMAREANPEARIRAFLRAAIEQSLSGSVPKGCMIACVAVDSATFDPQIQTRVRGAIEATEAAIIAELSGDLGVGTAATLAGLLISLMQGVAIRARAGVDRAGLEEFSDATIALFRQIIEARSEGS